MKVMALRSINKINSNVFQNCRRLFSYKFEMTPASRTTGEQEEQHVTASDEPIEMGSFRYNVCQPRTSPVDKPSMVGDTFATQRQSAKAAIEEQHLQPAMLPEYYQKQMERNALINPNPDPSEEDKVKINSLNPRRFQVSKTYANAVFPLKSVKLASPFPEPVKIMMSRTISDDEKAEQMLADSKSQKQFSEWSRAGPGHPSSRTYSTAARRWYSKTVSRDPEKCKKYDGTKKGCPKLKIRDCPAPARTKCDRLPTDLDCKKQESPYPAYSEFCHEEIDEKPSECKLCPWKPEENPNFKPPKKGYHTTSADAMRRTGLEVEQTTPTAESEPCPPSEGLATGIEEDAGMLCDLRKGECERPKNRRCPPTKEEIRKKKEEERKKKKEKECEGVLNNEQLLTAESVPELSMADKGPKYKRKKAPCNIKKFPFTGKCDPPKRTGMGGKCPPTKKRQSVEDCPPCGGKCSASGNESSTSLEYSMKNDEVKRDKRKCPHVDMTIDKKEEDDPCHLKRKGTTKICPGDLLTRNKRRRPKKPFKKSSEVVPPIEAPAEPQQPTTSI